MANKKIISVGYKINTPIDDIHEIIKSVLGEEFVDKYNIDSETLSGVYYDSGCPGVGRSNASAPQSNMMSWYNSKKNRVFNGVIKKIWIIKKPLVIICEVIICNNRFYSVMAKPHDRFHTTGVKNGVNSGNYGDPIDCSIKITARRYIYFK